MARSPDAAPKHPSPVGTWVGITAFGLLILAIADYNLNHDGFTHKVFGWLFDHNGTPTPPTGAAEATPAATPTEATQAPASTTPPVETNPVQAATTPPTETAPAAATTPPTETAPGTTTPPAETNPTPATTTPPAETAPAPAATTPPAETNPTPATTTPPAETAPAPAATTPPAEQRPPTGETKPIDGAGTPPKAETPAAPPAQTPSTPAETPQAEAPQVATVDMHPKDGQGLIATTRDGLENMAKTDPKSLDALEATTKDPDLKAACEAAKSGDRKALTAALERVYTHTGDYAPNAADGKDSTILGKGDSVRIDDKGIHIIRNVGTATETDVLIEKTDGTVVRPADTPMKHTGPVASSAKSAVSTTPPAPAPTATAPGTAADDSATAASATMTDGSSKKTDAPTDDTKDEDKK